MCNIVTEFYLYSIVYIYLINSRLDVTNSVRHHFRTATISVWNCFGVTILRGKITQLFPDIFNILRMQINLQTLVIVSDTTSMLGKLTFSICKIRTF